MVPGFPYLNILVPEKLNRVPDGTRVTSGRFFPHGHANEEPSVVHQRQNFLMKFLLAGGRFYKHSFRTRDSYEVVVSVFSRKQAFKICIAKCFSDFCYISLLQSCCLRNHNIIRLSKDHKDISNIGH